MNDKAREAFEAKVAPQFDGFDFTWQADRKCYKDHAAHMLWVGFQAALQWAASQQAAKAWRSVETPPDRDQHALVAGPTYEGSGTAMELAWWSSKRKEWQVGDYDAPWATHWRELPDAPTAQGEREEQ